MKIQLSWDDDAHTIIRYDYNVGWTWEDFRTAGKLALELASTTGQPFHIIANFADGAFPPMGALGHFKTAQESLPKQTLVVVVGGGMFINALVSAFSQVNRNLSKNLMVATSLEAARAKIVALRAQSAASRV